MHQQRSAFFYKEVLQFSASRIILYILHINREIIVAKLQKSCKQMLPSYGRIVSYVN